VLVCVCVCWCVCVGVCVCVCVCVGPCVLVRLCTRRESAELWKVVLGLTNLDHPSAHSQSRGVRSIIVHPRYNRAVVDYDISVVQLDSEVRRRGRTALITSSDCRMLMSDYVICRWRRRRSSNRCVCLGPASCHRQTPTATSAAGVTWATGVSAHTFTHTPSHRMGWVPAQLGGFDFSFAGKVSFGRV